MRRPRAQAPPATRFSLQRLRGELSPFRLHWFPRLRSTNDQAALMRKRGELFAPAIVLTGHQTAGRGRGAHAWWSGSGCLTVTFVVSAGDDLRPQEIPLIAGLAVRQAAADLTGRDNIRLKWPNDVVISGRKLAGLLCERTNRVDLIGIGLNVQLDRTSIPRDLRERVVALADLTSGELTMTDALKRVAESLHEQLRRRAEHSFAAFVREYQQHDALCGKRVTILIDPATSMTGKCQGIDDSGRLLLKTTQGVVRIVAGHVMATRE